MSLLIRNRGIGAAAARRGGGEPNPFGYVGADVATIDSGDIVLTPPAGSAEGDLLIALLAVTRSWSELSVPTGWTVIADQQDGTDVTSLRAHIVAAWKLAGASEGPSTWSLVSGTNTSTDNGGLLLAYGDAQVGNTASTYEDSSETAPAPAPSVVTVADDAILLCLWAARRSIARTLTTTAVTSRESLDDVLTPLLAGDETRPTAGATGTRAASSSGSLRQNLAVSVAIEPA